MSALLERVGLSTSQMPRISIRETRRRDALRRELAASREDVAQFVEADSAAVSGAGLPEETHRRLGAHEETVADDLDALLLMVSSASRAFFHFVEFGRLRNSLSSSRSRA